MHDGHWRRVFGWLDDDVLRELELSAFRRYQYMNDRRKDQEASPALILEGEEALQIALIAGKVHRERQPGFKPPPPDLQGSVDDTGGKPECLPASSAENTRPRLLPAPSSSGSGSGSGTSSSHRRRPVEQKERRPVSLLPKKARPQAKAIGGGTGAGVTGLLVTILHGVFPEAPADVIGAAATLGGFFIGYIFTYLSNKNEDSP